ncbi:TetR-like C-terminal domain-containing protein, partial [Peterkaempfera griseoplana]|uniref:TetR-like C-terminal domain-containing protein n=1 Tax=Peterkaempfera griseoplana TaxID=66896 RepID=UPI0006E1D7D5
ALSAAAELLLSQGMPGVTFAKVAGLAGVSKMTLYKWWSSPGSLAFEAYFTVFEDTLAFPRTGDIRHDLTTQLHAFVELLGRSGNVMAEIIGAAQSDPDLAAALSTQYVRKRRNLAVERLALAQQAGQIRRDVDLETLVDQLWGACYHRLLLPSEPLDTDFADRLIGNLLAGIAPSGEQQQ